MMSLRRASALVVVALVLLVHCTDSDEASVDSRRVVATVDVTLRPAEGWEPFPVNEPFDYQLGADYVPPDDVTVVVRDWFEGNSLPNGYSICYVNAFQTQPDADGVDRPDEASNWPSELVLSELGDDPDWAGEYLIDLATPLSRQTAAGWVEQMIQTCADKGFDAVEFDNLDSWTRFDGTPIADRVPFGPTEAAAYARLLTAHAHASGMASAQKNTLDLAATTVAGIGFDFLIIEQCGQLGECATATRLYGDEVLAIEYESDGFAAACDALGDRSSVVLRDVALSQPTLSTYVYEHC